MSFASFLMLLLRFFFALCSLQGRNNTTGFPGFGIR